MDVLVCRSIYYNLNNFFLLVNSNLMSSINAASVNNKTDYYTMRC